MTEKDIEANVVGNQSDYRSVDEWWRARDKAHFGEVAPCRFCRRAALAYHTTALTQCDGCWEVMSHLEGFLRDGGDAAEKFVHELFVHLLAARMEKK